MTVDFNDPITIAAMAAFFTSLLKPFVERLPFARPQSDLHDSTVVLLNVLISAAIPLVVAASSGTLSPANIGLYVLQAGAGVSGSYTGYKTLTKLGQSVGAVAGKKAAAAKAAQTAPDAPDAPSAAQVLQEAEAALAAAKSLTA